MIKILRNFFYKLNFFLLISCSFYNLFVLNFVVSDFLYFFTILIFFFVFLKYILVFFYKLGFAKYYCVNLFKVLDTLFLIQWFLLLFTYIEILLRKILFINTFKRDVYYFFRFIIFYDIIIFLALPFHYLLSFYNFFAFISIFHVPNIKVWCDVLMLFNIILFLNSSSFFFLIFIIWLDSIFKLNALFRISLEANILNIVLLLQNKFNYMRNFFMSTNLYYVEIQIKFDFLRSTILKHYFYFLKSSVPYSSFNFSRKLEKNYMHYSNNGYCVICSLNSYYDKGRDYFLLYNLRTLYFNCCYKDKNNNVCDKNFIEMFKTKDSFKLILAELNITEYSFFYGSEYKEIFFTVFNLIKFFKKDKNILQQFRVFAYNNKFYEDVSFCTDSQILTFKTVFLNKFDNKYNVKQIR